jgi:hypothetical protein
LEQGEALRNFHGWLQEVVPTVWHLHRMPSPWTWSWYLMHQHNGRVPFKRWPATVPTMST